MVFNKDSRFINVSRANIIMKKIFVDINSNLQAVKCKKTKLIKFSSVEVVEITKRFKKLAQIIKEQTNLIDVIKQILNTFIEICFYELLDISFKLFKQMFRSIIDEKIKAISKKKNHCSIKRHRRKESAHEFE